MKEFTVGPYTLGRRDNSDALYAIWYDEKTKRTKRTSLRTSDWEAAKTRLLELYQETHKLPSDYAKPSSVKLQAVLDDYWQHHGKKLISATTVTILLRNWKEFWGDATVADVRDVNRQEEFHEFLQAKGYAPNSVNRTLEIGRAAIRRAWKRGVIDSCPYIHTVEGEFDKPLGRPLSIDELRAFYRGSNERHWQDFFLLMLGTGSRPKAVITLHKYQIDFSEGLINLQPAGRKQTTKFRPTVRLPATLEARFKDRPDGALIVFHGKAVGKMDHAIRRARKKANLSGKVNAYSLRHTVARYLRKEGVDTAEIAAQLGHKRFGHDMTLRYMPHAPDYLEKSCAALERLLQLVIAENAPALRQKSKKAA